MKESQSDLRQLQELLDSSYSNAGAHLRSIFEKQLVPTARELAGILDGIFEMHLAVIRNDGSPIVAPIDGIFFKGKIWFGFPPKAFRGNLVRKDSRISASYTRGSFAFIVHGRSHQVMEADAAFADYVVSMRELYVTEYGPGWNDWYAAHKAKPGEEYNAWIEPTHFFVKK